MHDVVGSESHVYAAFTGELEGPWIDGAPGVPRRLAGAALAAPQAAPDRPYAANPKSTALALSAMMALGIVAVHAALSDRSEQVRLAGVQRAEKDIAEHNQARNLLIQQLANDHSGKLAHLRGYAEQIDQLAARPQSVVIFTPAEPNAQPEVAALPDLRRRIETDLERIETWTPPPLRQGNPDMTFTAGELNASRTPLAAALGLALAALIVWSARAMRNLPALRAASALGPSRAALCWLLPGANLYLPFVVMRDIWQGSDPTCLTSPQRLRLPVISLWWLAALGALGGFGYSTYLLLAAKGAPAMVEAVHATFYADIGLAALAAVTFVIVASAAWNQSLRADLVMHMEAQIGRRRAWRKID